MTPTDKTFCSPSQFSTQCLALLDVVAPAVLAVVPKARPRPHLAAVIDLPPVASTALPLEVALRALALRVVALPTPPQSVLVVALRTLPKAALRLHKPQAKLLSLHNSHLKLKPVPRCKVILHAMFNHDTRIP